MISESLCADFDRIRRWEAGPGECTVVITYVKTDGSTKKRDRTAYDKERYLRLKAMDEWIKSGRSLTEQHIKLPLHEINAAQRPGEGDDEYLKRIHRNAKRLYHKDPQACSRLYPKWSPKRAQTHEQRRKKNADAMKAARAAKKAARTAALAAFNSDSNVSTECSDRVSCTN